LSSYAVTVYLPIGVLFQKLNSPDGDARIPWGIFPKLSEEAVKRVEVVEFYIRDFGIQVSEATSSARFALRLYNT
jgi:hypothetical protein